MAALLALAREVARRLAGGAGRRALIGGGVGGGLSQILPGFGDDGDGRRRRRRRRNVLTASDRADIAFIAGSLGKAAGRDFAMIVAAR